MVNTVKVLFKEYRVAFEKNLHDGNAELYGEMDSKLEIITLDEDLSEDQKNATLLHEIIHALDDVMAIDLKEEQVIKLANGLYMLAKQNDLLILPRE